MNLLALLHYRIDSGDDLFLNHIKSYDKISTLSVLIYKIKFFILCDQIQTKMCNKVKTNTFFVILADKTTEVSRVEQFSLFLRHFVADVIQIREDFLQFVPAYSTTGLELSKTNISKLSSLGLN